MTHVNVYSGISSHFNACLNISVHLIAHRPEAILWNTINTWCIYSIYVQMTNAYWKKRKKESQARYSTLNSNEFLICICTARYFDWYSPAPCMCANFEEAPSFSAWDEIGYLQTSQGPVSLRSSSRIWASSCILWIYPVPFLDLSASR